MKYTIILTPRAARDAEDAYAWIARDAPDTAVQWYNRLIDTLQKVETMPNRCPLAREATTVRRPIRQLLFGNYRILFIIQGKAVKVLHIRHGARSDATSGDLG